MEENKLLEKYKQFIKETDSNPFDFLLEVRAIDLPAVKAEEKRKFNVLGKNKAGCLVCTYPFEKEGEFVVWLDSEGAPNAVFARDIAEFFSLLPYGTGFIYDVIVAALRNKGDMHSACKQHENAATILSNKREENYIDVYEGVVNIQPHAKPCSTIVNNIANYQQYFLKALNL